MSFNLRISRSFILVSKGYQTKTSNSVWKNFMTSGKTKRIIDRRLFLEFFELNSFDNEELEKSYHKYVVPKNSQTRIINYVPTREDFKRNLAQIIENSHSQSNVNHLDGNSISKDVQLKNNSLTVDEILTFFPPNKVSTSTTSSIKSVSPTTSNNTNNTVDKSLKIDGTQPSHSHSSDLIDFEYYSTTLRSVGNKLDDRIWAVTVSFALTGASIGMIIPCMPFLVKELQLSSSEFGLVITSFAIAKLLTNIPAAHYVDLIGRKNMLVSGLSLCALGIGGIGE